MSTKLILKNGAFYRGSELIPPEIGNVEQIALLQKRERQLSSYQKNGIKCYFSVKQIEYDAEVSFDCLCSKNLTKSKSGELCGDLYIDFKDSLLEDFKGVAVQCSDCGLIYTIDKGWAILKK